VVNTPKRGVGDTSVQKIAMAARGGEVSMAEAARLMTQTDEISGKGAPGCIAFLRDLDRWAEQSEPCAMTSWRKIILDESGYTAMWREDKSPQAAGRLDNLKELVRSMGEFDSLEAFLEHIALVSDADRKGRWRRGLRS
jgi:DNA helicase-2/ATP-dependent DNA helicase PcrA